MNDPDEKATDGWAADPWEEAMAFLLGYATANDINAPSHFFHISDGDGDTCGCPFEGEAGRRWTS